MVVVGWSEGNWRRIVGLSVAVVYRWPGGEMRSGRGRGWRPQVADGGGGLEGDGLGRRGGPQVPDGRRRLEGEGLRVMGVLEGRLLVVWLHAAGGRLRKLL